RVLGREAAGAVLPCELARAVLEDARHVRARTAELLLQLRAPALGLERAVRLVIAAGRHQAQGDTVVGPRVGREKDGGHSGARSNGRSRTARCGEKRCSWPSRAAARSSCTR